MEEFVKLTWTTKCHIYKFDRHFGFWIGIATAQRLLPRVNITPLDRRYVGSGMILIYNMSKDQ